MGHHIDNEGRFQSDKYPDLAPDKIVLSFKDFAARQALWIYAELTDDDELGKDIMMRILDLETDEDRPADIQIASRGESTHE